jgi:GNAT superfamily N-acetyltransferase
MPAVLRIEPLTPDRWDDLVVLFGPNGACSGCWCMWWLKPAKDWDRDAGDANRRQFQRLVRTGPPPGLLAYRDGDPIGWCALAPRDGYVRLNRSPKLKAIDDTPVWAVTCFFIHRKHRAAGVASALLDAAIAWARKHGARVVEGYPIDTANRATSNAAAFTGTLDMFEAAGFVEAARRGGRPIVRRAVSPRR